MSVPIFVKPEPRDPFKGARDTLLGGINQMVEQDVLSKLVKSSQSQQGDPLENLMENLLGSNLPIDRQTQIMKAFEPQLKQKALEKSEQLKFQREQAAFQSLGDKVFGDVNSTGTDARQGDSIEDQIRNIDQSIQQVLQSPASIDVKKQMLGVLKQRREDLANRVVTQEKEASKLTAQREAGTIKDVLSSAGAAEEIIEGINGLESLIATGETGPNARNLLLNATKDAPGLGNVIHNFLTTTESQGFESAKAQFLPLLKPFFGGQVRVAEMETFLDTLARFGTDPEAQRYALNVWKNYAQKKLAERDAVFDLLNDDGTPVKGFTKKLNKRLKNIRNKYVIPKKTISFADKVRERAKRKQQ